MMQSCASAAKLRAAGPFSRSASSARFEYGFPPPRIVNSAVVLKTQRERRMVLSAMLVPVSPFRTLDVRRRPQWFANGDKAPERNDQFACQRDDHGLARATTAVGRAAAI